MNSKLLELKEKLIELKEKQNLVEIESLLKCIDEIDTSDNEFILEKCKSNNENTMSIEMFKSVISAGQSAVKLSMIINGGGAVSLLAFIGNIWSIDLNKYILHFLSTSIVFFSLGILFTSIASGTIYLTQWAYASEKSKIGFWINNLSIIFIFCSYITFLSAVYFSIKAFNIN